MSFLHKRSGVGLLLLIYILSYFLQSWFFVDVKSVFAENTTDRTHLVAVLVDKDIYKDLSSDIEWYTTHYIQNRISNSKAIVLPINTKNFKAVDVVKMLENMYFDGVKGETSDLLGVILLGDVPLPVVQQNGFVYPSIYPYVDFEDQQFIYDSNQQFFVYNNNPKGQPEIWHGIVNFGTHIDQYKAFFTKLRTYLKSPTTFVSSQIWYDDFIGMKNSFSTDTLPYYINNFVFTEDIGYHRYTNLMLDYFKSLQNDGVASLLGNLSSISTDNATLASLQASGQASFSKLGNSLVPTAMLSTTIKELMKSYDTLYPGVFLSKMRDNIQAASRWYKPDASGALVDAVDSHLYKIMLKDVLSVGDMSNGISPVMISYNDQLEKALDQKISAGQWYMTVPVPLTYTHQNYQSQSKKLVPLCQLSICSKKWCETTTNDVYKNYYFGVEAADITSAQQFSAYRGTYRNLTQLSGVLVADPLYAPDPIGKTLGSSYNAFATQVEGNRGYNLMAAAGDYDVYKDKKIQTHKNVACSKWMFTIRGNHYICMGKSSSYVGDEKETMEEFAVRSWGGASSINLDTGLMASEPPVYKLKTYNYKSSLLPIYDIGGSKAIDLEQSGANSFLGLGLYGSAIKVQDRYGIVDYSKYIGGDTANYPSEVYGPEQKGFREILGTAKMTVPYSTLDFFSVYNDLSNRGIGSNRKEKIITVNNSKVADWRSSSSIGGSCGGKYETFAYTYTTVDSRVKNVSPTPDQINGTSKNIFSQDGLFWKHYNFLNTYFQNLSTQTSVSFASILSDLQTGVQQSQLIKQGILDFAHSSSTSAPQLLTLINQVFPASQQSVLTQLVGDVQDRLDIAQSDIGSLNMQPVFSYFDRIQELENIYNQKTIFLSGWMSNLDTNLTILKSNFSGLGSSFPSLVSAYSTLKNFDYGVANLTAKRAALSAISPCGSSSLGYQGTYAAVCKAIDDTKVALALYTGMIYHIESFTGTFTSEDNSVVTTEVKPFDDLKQVIDSQSSSTGFVGDIDSVKTYLSNKYVVQVLSSGATYMDKTTVNFVVSNTEPPLSYEPGLNQGTADRPIDSPKNITFQGLGGDLVKFTYPNLYDVKVYDLVNGVLVLKSLPDIKKTIQLYLIGKVKEYNTLLTTQYSKRLSYYARYASGFSLLALTDPLASPNRQYQDTLPDNYFIDALGSSQIDALAEILYYQNLPTYTRKPQQYIDQDLASIRSSFDISKKIAYVVSGYLAQHDDYGSLISPGYNSTGYEVAYINSDGADYIDVGSTPDFISTIQKRQSASKQIVSNTLIEDTLAADPTYTKTLADCGIDPSYSEYIFQMNNGSVTMPWVDRLKCWWKKLPTSMKFSMELAQGPSFQDFLHSLESSYNQWLSGFDQTKKGGADFSGNLGEYWSSVTQAGIQPVIQDPKVQKIVFQMPTTTVLAGGQIPFTLAAFDAQGKPVKSGIMNYHVVVNSGDGQFVGPAYVGQESQEFSDFENTVLVYQAPRFSKTTSVTLVLTGGGFSQTQKLLIQPSVLKISSPGVTLYAGDKVLQDYSFSLTGIDSTYSTMPSLMFSLTDRSGTPLHSTITITSRQGLVVPGLILSGTFRQATSYLVDGGKLKIFLMPNFHVGDDELYIQIPGLDPFSLPVHVRAGSPYTLDIRTASSSLSIGQQLSGELRVADAWGNLTTSPVAVNLGAMGPISFGNKVVTVHNGIYPFVMKTAEPGGSAYLYAYLQGISLDNQSPGYKAVAVQNSYLPKDKLNVLYLNLFGTDWGNQWGYGSENSGYVTDLLRNSDKLLAVTTQLIDPAKLKKFDVIVREDGQVHNLSTTTVGLDIFSGQLIANVEGEASIGLGIAQNIALTKVDDESILLSLLSKNRSASLFLLPDSSIDGLVVSGTQMIFSGQILADLGAGFWSDDLKAQLSETLEDGYSYWDLSYGSTSLGRLVFVRSDDWILLHHQVTLSSAIQYGWQQVFAEGSTNGLQGIGIYDTQGSYEKQGNPSIEDSSNYELGIGFTSDFKNITLFGDGKSVGDATIPYASAFLVNYGDPLLTRMDANRELSGLNLDTGIGEQIYSEPGKTIFKVLPVDINNDSLQDLIVVFNDGTVKYLKNYGGNHPYKNLQDLLRLADGIKDVMVGDADGNGYPDLLVWNTSDQLRVYTNDRGVFDVDGSLVCLNTNAFGSGITLDPGHIKGVQQISFEDMDKDGKIDIVTNDAIGDIKIFYGGGSTGKGNYISTLPYACDASWFVRQKNAVKVVKSFGLRVDSDTYIQDSSLVHVNGWYIPQEDVSAEDENVDSASTGDAPSILQGSSMPDMTSMIGGMSSFLQTTATTSFADQLLESPVQILPSYESAKTIDDIGYKKLISLSGNKDISIYKQYTDLNGGILQSGDQVKITTTFFGVSGSTVHATYFDRLAGPWQVLVDDAHRITSWKIEEGSYAPGNIHRTEDDDSQFMMDGITLGYHQKLVTSYVVRYMGGPLVTMHVRDEVLSGYTSQKDTYPDIIISPVDSCKKYRRIFFNTSSNSHKSYEEVFDNIQAKIDAYLAAGQKEGQDLMTSGMPTVSSTTDTDSAENTQAAVQGIMDQVMNQDGMQSMFESWNTKDMFTTTVDNGANVGFNMDALDKTFAPMQKKLESLTDSLCQGFKLGKGGCQPPAPFNMIPFNQAFLAPGNYHVFGCVPKPLKALFKAIDKQIGKGIPALFFPGTFQAGPYQIPMLGSAFLPIVFQNAASDGFGYAGSYPPKTGIYPSQVRMYLVPTLTMQMGVAVCFGPYQAGANIPKLFRDLGGNCVVTAFPLYKGQCGGSSLQNGDVPTEVLDSWMTDLAANGECTNPPQIGHTKVIANTLIMDTDTQESALGLSSIGPVNSSWTMAVPNGNFGGFGYVSYYDKPLVTTVAVSSSPSKVSDNFALDSYISKMGPTIDLKVLGANSKGLMKALMQDRFGRQIKYMVNNLTKLTVSITLPDLTQLGDGLKQFADAGSWSEAYAAAKKTDLNKSTKTNSSLQGLDKVSKLFSKQQIANVSDTVNNPFDSLISMFQQVPLVDLHTKDITIKTPMITSQEILKYTSYLKGWLTNQSKVLKQWVEAVNEVLSACGSMTPNDAQTALNNLDKEQILIQESSVDKATKDKLLLSLQKERLLYQGVLKQGDVTVPSFSANMVESRNTTKTNFGFLGQRLVGLPRLKWTEKTLLAKSSLTQEESLLLKSVQTTIGTMSSCGNFASSMDKFVKFYGDSTTLVKNVQQNIVVLQQYKEFPNQLYEWMHFVDKYMGDLSNFLSNTVFVLMNWMNVNAKIYAKWVDALILIVSTIKTWQILIDFSTNRSKKCGKCSRDSYGSYSCSLSFLFPKIPILPIPPFKIPNIYLDLSHVDLGIDLEIPRFHFVPVNIALPQLPNLPSPPNITISSSTSLSLSLGSDFDMFDGINVPNIPILPGPPTLPELPSFIPKVDFKLPTLPPAPKIPNILPKISSTINVASSVAKIFCILKQGIGLVGEKGIKSKVEQLTQRTWDVPYFDFFNQTSTWKKDPPLKGFDLKLDSYVQFKMDFEGFYGFLDQIVGVVNGLSSSMENASKTYIQKPTEQASKWLDNYAQENIKDVDFNAQLNTNLDLDLKPLDSVVVDSGLDYATAHTQLLDGLAYFEKKADDADLERQIGAVVRTLKTPTVINPATAALQKTQKDIQLIFTEKQQEIRKLANNLKQYDRFVARVGRDDVALVSDKTTDMTFSTSLFTTNEATRTLLAQQEHPLKMYLDTNATLVNRYLTTFESSTPAELQIDESTYKKSTTYLSDLRSKIDGVYDSLGISHVGYTSCGVPLLASSTATASTSSSPAAASTVGGSTDLSSYVRGIFVDSGTSKVNVVKSDVYIGKIADHYLPLDINTDKVNDLLMWDDHGIYVKYGKQNTSYPNNTYYTRYYGYDVNRFFSSWYIDSYQSLLQDQYPKYGGYVSFDDTQVRLVHPESEVKNFKMVGQNFDAIQFSWTANESLGEQPDGYLLKLNQRSDTYNDKDQSFRFFDDAFLNKRYVLLLPADTQYGDAHLDIGERYYYKGKNADNDRSLMDFLPGGQYSGLILAVKYYDPSQKNIMLALEEIPRHWQYSQVTTLRNLGTTGQQKYVVSAPWSNQVVAGRQLMADTVSPDVDVTLFRPQIQELVSSGTDHKGFVGTHYTLDAHWKDNVAVAKMWIQQDNTILAMITGDQQTGFIQLTGLYFTGEQQLDYIFGAEDFQGNKQLTPVKLSIGVPDITMKDIVQISATSGQLISELSHDIDDGMVLFQRLRNETWQQITGTLSNVFGGFWVGPRQTIVTGSVFSIGNTVGFFDDKGTEVGSLSADGNIVIFPYYQDRYKIGLDLSSSLPAVRILDIKNASTLFWVHLPPKELVSVTLYQQRPFYDKIDLSDPSFGVFAGGSCIQGIDKQCLVYISQLGEVYIPKTVAQSLQGEYRYDSIHHVVIYVIKDFQGKDIAMITVKVNVIGQ